MSHAVASAPANCTAVTRHQAFALQRELQCERRVSDSKVMWAPQLHVRYVQCVVARLATPSIPRHTRCYISNTTEPSARAQASRCRSSFSHPHFAQCSVRSGSGWVMSTTPRSASDARCNSDRIRLSVYLRSAHRAVTAAGLRHVTVNTVRPSVGTFRR